MVFSTHFGAYTENWSVWIVWNFGGVTLGTVKWNSNFVHDHDDQLDGRPLMDYGVEANPFYVYDMPSFGSAYAWHPFA